MTTDETRGDSTFFSHIEFLEFPFRWFWCVPIVLFPWRWKSYRQNCLKACSFWADRYFLASFFRASLREVVLLGSSGAEALGSLPFASEHTSSPPTPWNGCMTYFTFAMMTPSALSAVNPTALRFVLWQLLCKQIRIWCIMIFNMLYSIRCYVTCYNHVVTWSCSAMLQVFSTFLFKFLIQSHVDMENLFLTWCINWYIPCWHST